MDGRHSADEPDPWHPCTAARSPWKQCHRERTCPPAGGKRPRDDLWRSGYAKRLIKLIDDCGTKQKAYYLACLARALLSKQIDTQKFFQLSRCIRNLTEEDLLFLSERIEPGNISRDEDYVDDYRALGLIYETDEGFSYSKRAFELKKYALCYETHIEIPDSFPPKYEPFVGQAISGDEINALTGEVNQLKENQQWKTHM